MILEPKSLWTLKKKYSSETVQLLLQLLADTTISNEGVANEAATS